MEILKIIILAIFVFETRGAGKLLFSSQGEFNLVKQYWKMVASFDIYKNFTLSSLVLIIVNQKEPRDTKIKKGLQKMIHPTGISADCTR